MVKGPGAYRRRQAAPGRGVKNRGRGPVPAEPPASCSSDGRFSVRSPRVRWFRASAPLEATFLYPAFAGGNTMHQVRCIRRAGAGYLGGMTTNPEDPTAPTEAPQPVPSDPDTDPETTDRPPGKPATTDDAGIPINPPAVPRS
jgi:hypothetical protein